MKTELSLQSQSLSHQLFQAAEGKTTKSGAKMVSGACEGLVAWLMTLVLPVTEALLGIVNEAKLCQ